MRIFLSILFVYCAVEVFAQKPLEFNLSNNWKFKNTKDKNWLPAIVPGTVHTDLLNNQKIKDPHLHQNEQELQWVENENWEYSCEFNCEEAVLNHENISLQFYGLDTYAKIYLNGIFISETNNMFRTWRPEVKKHLKKGSNTLRILFESSVNKGKELAQQIPYTLPGDEKIFTRKAQYQYGWDWGPRLVTCGVWRSVKLVAWNSCYIKTIHCIQQSQTTAKAELACRLEINCNKAGEYEIALSNETEKLPLKTQKIQLKKGSNAVSIPYTIDQPKLWWCNGLGEPHIYLFNLVLSQNGKVLHSKQVKTGIRKIELLQQKDVSGKSFYFKLNDVPVFTKGANWIPADNFIPRITRSKYEQLIKDAADANMNMLRVWGGGIYESDEFYELCDENGILVWQDFMFACAMYPGDKTFVNNVKEEAIDNVKRLRNHPCIALWCGNNEIDEGWHNWGWQQQYNYSSVDSAKIWKDYTAVFYTTLKQVIDENDPSRTYWPSSPSIGWGRKESLLSGDAHYWGVWWGMEPFEIYKNKTGRFMSEYGFQGMPALSYCKQFCDDSLSLHSSCLYQHQKHPRGFETINTYMQRDYSVPAKFENYIYVSQLLQAAGIKTAIEAHRRAKPYCMGTLYWQLNDCWPVTSWSSIDAQGNWKALHYQVKKSFKDVLLSVNEDRNKYEVYIISDKQQKSEGALVAAVYNMEGKLLWSKTISVSIPENSSGIYLSIDANDLHAINKNTAYLSCNFVSKDGNIRENCISYFVKPKDMTLPVPLVQTKVNEADNTIEVSTDVLAKDVYLYLKDREIKLDDNFFDLLPGEKKTILVKEKGIDLKKIRVKTLVNANL